MVIWAPIVISFLALILSLIAFRASRRSSKFTYFGSMISNILALNLNHPEFDDPEFTNKYPDVDTDLKREYDIYAKMVWNCIGLISLEYGSRIDSCPFTGSVLYWSKMHRKWIETREERQYYKGIFIAVSLLDKGDYVNFDPESFPEIAQSKRRQKVRSLFKGFVYYYLFYPVLFPFSAQYRKDVRDLMRRGS